VPRVVIAKVKSSVIINGFKQMVNDWIPWLPSGSVERPSFCHGPCKELSCYLMLHARALLGIEPRIPDYEPSVCQHFRTSDPSICASLTTG
jgi:hypothetical protein